MEAIWTGIASGWKSKQRSKIIVIIWNNNNNSHVKRKIALFRSLKQFILMVFYYLILQYLQLLLEWYNGE